MGRRVLDFLLLEGWLRNCWLLRILLGVFDQEVRIGVAGRHFASVFLKSGG